jgi:hypothetical protein
MEKKRVQLMGPNTPIQKCMTLLEYFKHKLVHEKKRGEKKSPEKQPHEDHQHSNNPPKDSEIFTIAVVLDGVVQEVLRAEGRLAALLLSEPQLIDVSEFTGDDRPTIGWVKSESGFSKPEVPSE